MIEFSLVGQAFTRDARPVVAIGNFDGLHPGHRAIIKRATRRARTYANQEHPAPVVAMVFDPHPRIFFASDKEPFLLTSIAERADFLRQAGVDTVLVARFDDTFARITAQSFVHEVLANQLHACAVVVGGGFHFGHKALGNGTLLRSLSASLDIAVDLVEPVLTPHGDMHASRRIREALRTGEPQTAKALLGRTWSFTGQVVRGDKRGRTLGWPTANISWPDGIIKPAHGVYAVSAQLPNGEKSSGVASIGIRPMFPTPLMAEVHLFDWAGDLYGQDLTVELCHFLRRERDFANTQDLTAQIEKDAQQARAHLSTLTTADLV